MRALPRLTIAMPCHVEWKEMVGDERVRYCGTCLRHVYNVAAMNRRQVDRLINTYEGKPPCLRIFRRPDGTLVTRRCVDSVQRAARLLWLRAATVAAMAIAFWTDVVLLRLVSGSPPVARPSPAAVEAPAPAGQARVKRLMGQIEEAKQYPSFKGGEPTAGLPNLEERPRRIPVKHRPLRPDQEPLSKAEVVTAMNELRPAAAACGTRFGVQGVVMLNVTFKANGAVRAEVTGRHAGTACARFIEDAASRLRVRRSAGLTTPYPFMVR